MPRDPAADASPDAAEKLGKKKHTISRPRFTKEGEVIHFGQPRVQASIGANTFVVSGATDTKRLEQLMPGIMSQLGPENEPAIKKIQELLIARRVLPNGKIDPAWVPYVKKAVAGIQP